MQVSLTLKNWKIVQDEKTKLPKITGTYSVMMGEKEIATQAFNDGYGAREVPFSGDTVSALMAVEATIKADLERLLA